MPQMEWQKLGIRTDLAMEAHELAGGELERPLPGIRVDRRVEEGNTVIKIIVEDEAAGRALGKLPGHYLTIQTPDFQSQNRDRMEILSRLLARESGVIRKPHGGRLRVALAFPNSYFVGMSNLGFHRAMRREGITVHVTKVGDRHVLERMLGEENNLGGEQSGHVIFLDHSTTGDGLVTALMLLEALVERGGPLSSLARVMEKVPQVLLNVPVKEKGGLAENKRVAEALKAWEERLGERGRVLLRPSGTEPVIRVMVEALEAEMADEAARDLAAVVAREMG